MRLNVRIIACEIEDFVAHILNVFVGALFFQALKLSTTVEENPNYMLAPGMLVWSVCVVTHGLEGALTMWNKILMITKLRQGKLI